MDTMTLPLALYLGMFQSHNWLAQTFNQFLLDTFSQYQIALEITKLYSAAENPNVLRAIVVGASLNVNEWRTIRWRDFTYFDWYVVYAFVLAEVFTVKKKQTICLFVDYTEPFHSHWIFGKSHFSVTFHE